MAIDLHGLDGAVIRKVLSDAFSTDAISRTKLLNPTLTGALLGGLGGGIAGAVGSAKNFKRLKDPMIRKRTMKNILRSAATGSLLGGGAGAVYALIDKALARHRVNSVQLAEGDLPEEQLETREITLPGGTRLAVKFPIGATPEERKAIINKMTEKANPAKAPEWTPIINTNPAIAPEIPELTEPIGEARAPVIPEGLPPARSITFKPEQSKHYISPTNIPTLSETPQIRVQPLREQLEQQPSQHDINIFPSIDQYLELPSNQQYVLTRNVTEQLNALNQAGMTTEITGLRLTAGRIVDNYLQSNGIDRNKLPQSTLEGMKDMVLREHPELSMELRKLTEGVGEKLAEELSKSNIQSANVEDWLMRLIGSGMLGSAAFNDLSRQLKVAPTVAGVIKAMSKLPTGVKLGMVLRAAGPSAFRYLGVPAVTSYLRENKMGVHFDPLAFAMENRLQYQDNPQKYKDYLGLQMATEPAQALATGMLDLAPVMPVFAGAQMPLAALTADQLGAYVADPLIKARESSKTTGSDFGQRFDLEVLKNRAMRQDEIQNFLQPYPELPWDSVLNRLAREENMKRHPIKGLTLGFERAADKIRGAYIDPLDPYTYDKPDKPDGSGIIPMMPMTQGEPVTIGDLTSPFANMSEQQLENLNIEERAALLNPIMEGLDLEGRPKDKLTASILGLIPR